MESIVWPAIKALQGSVPPKIYRQWEITSNGVLFRQLQFDIEREQILKRLSEEKISWLPLKGILLKDYYPLPGMRYMCDNDILYGITEPDPDGGYRIAGTTEEKKTGSIQTAQQKLRQIMKELGYNEKSLNGNHDIFMKDPIFNFEMHRDLVSTMHPLYEYYRNPWKFAVQDKKDSFRYHFSDEDEYIYLLVHAYKHYTGGGCGVRTLADEFVFLRKKGDNLDWDYLSGELAELHLTEFEQELSDAASHAFTRNAILTEQDCRIIGYMLGSGTYGNFQNHVKNEIQRTMDEENDTVESARKRYLRNRIWISEEKMKNFYPFFYRHKMMRIVLPVYRIIKGIIIHPQDLIREARIVKRIRKMK